ncbi:MAG TPA: PD-(D/E)XK nuclease family protein [Solirubrobacteraceae bacterium]|nr:PD-(D/E)XK nuclease family protein [Solirubrobacteraceae bacterium]
MPLRLVIGPANSAKAGEVLGAYAAQAPRGAVLVVPTSADARHYEEELAATGVVFAGVLTFSGLAGEIAARAGFSARRLTARQREAVLRRAVAGPPGLRAAAGALIAELHRSLVTPQRFTVALRAWAELDPSRSERAAMLSRLYRRYAAELERGGWVDAEQYAWRALDALRAAPDRWGGDAVFFYGFDDLTGLELDAVDTLSRIAGAAVTVSLTSEAGHPALAARARTLEELRPLAAEITELPARDEHYAPSARTALHALERGLFDPEAPVTDPGDAVVLLEAGGARAEAELIAARIRAIVAAGTPPQEIAVVRRAMGGAAGLLTAVLGEYGVAASWAGEVPFAHTPLGRGLRGAARCALAGTEATLADLLAYLRAPGGPGTPEEADALELAARQAGDGTAEAARRHAPPRPELDALAAAEDPAAALIALGRQCQAAGCAAAAPRLDDAQALDVRALAALVAAHRELEAIGLTPGALELLELLDELTVPAAPARPGAVVLAEPLALRARRFRVVCVGGLQEGAFPLLRAAEPLLSERDRRELAASCGLRLPLAPEPLDRERYLLYAALSRATEQVLISYCSSDEEGNLALASPFVADLRELLGEAWFARRERRLLSDVTWPAARAPTAREARRAAAAASAPGAGEPPELQRALTGAALAGLRHTEVVSAGALELYADCPVRWLVERELEPTALEPEAEPLSRGNLIHAVLEALLDELDGPLTAASLPAAEARLDVHLRRLARGDGAALGAGRPAVVRAGLLRGVRADLLRYLRHEAETGAGWRRHAVEQRFGFSDEESLPALELAGGVRVRGMIDRIDTDGAGHALVTDYKSGVSASNHPVARWAVDRRLQVALYLLAVRTLTDLEPVAGFYQPLRGDKLGPRGLYRDDVAVGSAVQRNDRRSAQEFAAELDAAGERAAALAGALRAGVVTPCPQNCSRDGCSFPGICRSQ